MGLMGNCRARAAGMIRQQVVRMANERIADMKGADNGIGDRISYFHTFLL